MKAVVLDAPGVLRHGEVPDPQPFGERPVLVRVGAVGVCGSDLLRVGHGTAYHYPLVLGHEFSAVVEQPPAGSRFSPGDRVAVFPLLPNPDDPLTEIGEPALGSGYDYFGSRRDGGLAELLWVPERNLVPVPASMPLLHAAMVEPAAVALHAVRKLTRAGRRLGPGDRRRSDRGPGRPVAAGARLEPGPGRRRRSPQAGGDGRSGLRDDRPG